MFLIVKCLRKCFVEWLQYHIICLPLHDPMWPIDWRAFTVYASGCALGVMCGNLFSVFECEGGIGASYA